MSFDVTWDVNKYRDEHESEGHWELRKAFMVKWKDNYPEERLICLARVFTNIELLGCRYPAEVMKEVAVLSQEVANPYRAQRRMLQRTFVCASDAAIDRARGVKRQGGIVKETRSKLTRINFVKQGETETIENSAGTSNVENSNEAEMNPAVESKSDSSLGIIDSSVYLNELLELQCVDVRKFKQNMFNTCFGKLVLLIRPWTSKICNLQASCQACHVPIQGTFEDHMYTILVNNKILAQTSGLNKQIAKQGAEDLAWEILKYKVISVLVKEQWIAQDDTRIGVKDLSSQILPAETFGTPIESSVASKMMYQMGWAGGSLGADAQGIAEPIKPHLQMINRAGLGSTTSDIRTFKQMAASLMQRYISSWTLDVDLVFSTDFSKEERAALHQTAQRHGLSSKSYGSNSDRFLVVKKKLDPFSIVQAVLKEGGNTAKYQVFIPVALATNCQP